MPTRPLPPPSPSPPSHPPSPPSQGPKLNAQRHPAPPKHSRVSIPPPPKPFAPPSTTTASAPPSTPTHARPYVPPTRASIPPQSQTVSTATPKSSARQPFVRRSPLLLTALVLSLTVTGTLYGAYLKQSHDAAAKERTQTESAEQVQEVDTGLTPTPGSAETLSSLALKSKRDAEEKLKQEKAQRAQIQRLEDARARLVSVKTGLEGKIEMLRIRMAKESEEKIARTAAAGDGNGRGESVKPG